MKKPAYTSILFVIEQCIHKAVRSVNAEGIQLNDAQIRSILNKVRKTSEAGSPKIAVETSRDKILADLHRHILQAREALMLEDEEILPRSLIITEKSTVQAFRISCVIKNLPYGGIEFIENGESLLYRATPREGAEAGFRIKFSDADGGKFFHQLIHADVPMLRQLAEPCMFVVGQSDGQGAHGSDFRNWVGD